MTTTAPTASAAPTRRRRVNSFVIVVSLVLLPLVVTLISLLGTHWHAPSDHALEVIKILDVGGRHTPLAGAQSRFGWDHPGPIFFWALAPFTWVAGETAALFGTGVINGLAIVGALVFARRRGGVLFALVLAIAALVLCRTLTTSLLIDLWNPWVGVVPFLFWMVLAWSVVERDFAALPWLVGVGSFLVQTHVGYAPMVLGVSGLTVALVFVPHHDEPSETWWTLGRSAIVSAIVAFLLWLPPLVQQLTGHPGNLGEIIRFFRHPVEQPHGYAFGWGVMGKELPFAWITGHDVGVIGTVETASTLGALLLLLIVAVLGVLAYRHESFGAARLAVLAIGSAFVGVIAGARITGLPGEYLVRWWWVIGLLLWVSMAWSAIELVRTAALERVMVPIGVGVVAVLSVWIAYMAVPAHVPLENLSVAVGRLRPQVEQSLQKNHRYLVLWSDLRNLGGSGIGLYLDLEQDGYRVRVTPEWTQGFGSWRTAHAGDVDGTITVVANDDAAAYVPLPGSKQIAHYDPLTPSQRARADELQAAIKSQLRPGSQFAAVQADTGYGNQQLTKEGADPKLVRELRALRAPGSAFTVYLSDSPSSNSD